ncbi:hypothetical protein PC115_g9123 [Phytophthora cactorum]|uniref:Uncharacterized protein n=1 Tax=Phytophthora cactorum TaxID=29920 RepID=A0A8T1CJU5_9STRA|nr:hypothetical protein PC115_g9123 [Phytophthora cactorum]
MRSMQIELLKRSGWPRYRRPTTGLNFNSELHEPRCRCVDTTIPRRRQLHHVKLIGEANKFGGYEAPNHE